MNRIAKPCTKCGETLPLEDFNRCSKVKDGRQAVCRKCANRIGREWGRAHPEIAKARQRKWIDENRETWRAGRRKRRANNPERVKGEQRKWRASHPAASREHTMRWRANHPEHWRAIRQARDVAKRKQRSEAVHEAIDPFEIFERDKWRCKICGRNTPKELRGTYEDNAPELDHIIPVSLGGPHVKANVQCACRACNKRKFNKYSGQLAFA